MQLATVEVVALSDKKDDDSPGLSSNESQLREAPFSNDLVTQGVFDDDPLADELKAMLSLIAHPAPVDLATADARLSLRGFPAPLLRDGFVHLGVPDELNTVRTLVIQGPLVPVLGRAAPGGIQDFQTARPRTKAARMFGYSVTSLQRQSATLEITGPVVPKRGWQRVAADWSRKSGPEQYAVSETRSSTARWRGNTAPPRARFTMSIFRSSRPPRRPGSRNIAARPARKSSGLIGRSPSSIRVVPRLACSAAARWPACCTKVSRMPG